MKIKSYHFFDGGDVFFISEYIGFGGNIYRSQFSVSLKQIEAIPTEFKFNFFMRILKNIRKGIIASTQECNR